LQTEITGTGSIIITAPGFGGVVAAVVVAIRARRGSLERIRDLLRSLEKPPATSGVRTDLPAEVIAFGLRLGGHGNEGPRIVRLSQTGEIWPKPGSKPIAFEAQQSIAIAEVGLPLAGVICDRRPVRCRPRAAARRQ
jgi:hypothetical protein